jgi:F-type H+-transporting ATPase subunit epsilon
MAMARREQATPVAELDASVIAQSIKDAEEDVADAETDAARDKARERLEQLNALKIALGQ